MDRASVLHQANASLGEGPVWDVRCGALYWVDIRRQFIHRFEPASGRQTGLWTTTASTGCVALTSSATRLLVAAGERVYLLDLSTGREEDVASLPIERPLMRANDGRVDASGRFWVGTMIDDIHAPESFRDGRLFCIWPDGRVEDAGIEAELPNGIGWSPDGSRMYLNDSTARLTRCFEFDARTARLGQERTLLAHPLDDGLPDGLCVDTEGCIWSGQWDGWNIKRISPSGEVLERFPAPVQRPSSVTFFGSDLGRLAFTSAANGFRSAHFLDAPDAGSLFELTVSVTGQAEHLFPV